MDYKETTSFEIVSDTSEEFELEAACPCCGGVITVNEDTGILEGDCEDCGKHFFCAFKLVMEW